MIVIRDLNFFFFDFDWSKDVQENLMHDIEYIIKNCQYLTENKIKNKTEPLLLKHKNGNNIQNKTNEPHKFVLNWSQRVD